MMSTAAHTFQALAARALTDLPAGYDHTGRIDEGGRVGRATHTAQTLGQWGKYGDSLPLEVADLGYAYEVLGRTQGQPGPERSRRHTCRQLSRIAIRTDGYPSGLRAEREALVRAIAVWEAVAQGYARLAELGDPRSVNVAAACAREALELRAELAALAAL